MGRRAVERVEWRGDLASRGVGAGLARRGGRSGVGIPPAFRNLVFGEILVFIAILTAAFAYAWRKGVFEWR